MPIRKISPLFRKGGMVFFLFLLNCFNFSNAQDSEELTLAKTIQLAVIKNKTIIKTLNSVEGQNSIIKNKYGKLFPSLTLNSGWTRTNQITAGENIVGGFTFNLGPTDKTTDNFNFSIRSDVTLFNGFSNYESVDIAKMTRRGLIIELEKLKQDVVLKVISDYITVLKNQQILKINAASLEDSKVELEKIKIFVEVGKRTLSDVYKQDVLVAQNELAVEQSKNNLDKSIADLVFDANLPQNRNYTVSQEEFSTDVAIESLQDYAQKNSNINLLTQTAVKNRNDYKSAQQDININEANVELSRNSILFPTVSGFSSYSLSGTKIGNIRDSRVFTIGITLSYPIFQGFDIDNQRQQAEITLKSSREDLEQVKNQISLDIKKAVLDLKSFLKQIEITTRSIKVAEQDKFLAEESYRVGMGTLLDVQTATTKYNNALIDKSNSVYNFILAQQQLEYYQGLLKY